MWLRCFRRRGIGKLLESLHGKVDKVLTDLTALNNAVDTLVANEAAVADAVSGLRDEVAQLSAGTITQEQIDSIRDRVTEVGEKLAADAADPNTPTPGGTKEEAAPAEGAPAEGAPEAGEPPVGGEQPAPGGATPPNDEVPAQDAEAPPADAEGPPSA